MYFSWLYSTAASVWYAVSWFIACCGKELLQLMFYISMKCYLEAPSNSWIWKTTTKPVTFELAGKPNTKEQHSAGISATWDLYMDLTSSKSILNSSACSAFSPYIWRTALCRCSNSWGKQNQCRELLAYVFPTSLWTKIPQHARLSTCYLHPPTSPFEWQIACPIILKKHRLRWRWSPPISKRIFRAIIGVRCRGRVQTKWNIQCTLFECVLSWLVVYITFCHRFVKSNVLTSYHIRNKT